MRSGDGKCREILFPPAIRPSLLPPSLIALFYSFLYRSSFLFPFFFLPAALLSLFLLLSFFLLHSSFFFRHLSNRLCSLHTDPPGANNHPNKIQYNTNTFSRRPQNTKNTQSCAMPFVRIGRISHATRNAALLRSIVGLDR